MLDHNTNWFEEKLPVLEFLSYQLGIEQLPPQHQPTLQLSETLQTTSNELEREKNWIFQ